VSGEITAEVTHECRITATNKRHKNIVQPCHYTHVAVMCGRPDLTFKVRLIHRSKSFALRQQPYLEGVTNRRLWLSYDTHTTQAWSVLTCNSVKPLSSCQLWRHYWYRYWWRSKISVSVVTVNSGIGLSLSVTGSLLVIVMVPAYSVGTQSLIHERSMNAVLPSCE